MDKKNVWYSISEIDDNTSRLYMNSDNYAGTYINSDDIRDMFKQFHEELSSVNIYLDLNDVKNNLNHQTMINSMSKISLSKEKPLMFRNEGFIYASIEPNEHVGFSLNGTINTSRKVLEERLGRIYNNTNEL